MESILKNIRRFDVKGVNNSLRHHKSCNWDFLYDLKKFVVKHDIIHRIVLLHKNSAEIFRILLNYIPEQELRTIIDNENMEGVTPLEIACNVGNWSCAILLIRLGANVNHSYRGNHEMFCPLGVALSHFNILNKKEVEKYGYEEENIIKVLLEHGANPNVNLGKHKRPYVTPLWVAIKTRQIWIVELLLGYGATIQTSRIRYRDDMPINILEYALGKGKNNNIERMLIEHCTEVEKKELIDLGTLIIAITEKNPEKIEIILAHFILYNTITEPKDCGYVISQVLKFCYADNRFLLEFMTLFPNMKNCAIKKKFGRTISLVDFSKQFAWFPQAFEIIKHFDCKLFDLVYLHLYYENIRHPMNT